MKNTQYCPGQVPSACADGLGHPGVRGLPQEVINEQTFFRWKKRFQGMGTAEVRRLRFLEEENRRLKQLVADLSLDKQMLQDLLGKKP